MQDGLTSQSVVFTSWKEIASYLGKGVRTVQRWEAQFGLPVQRPNARCKGIVRATREELDRWISTRWSLRTGRSDIPENGNEKKPLDAELGFSPRIDVVALHELRLKNRVLVEDLRRSVEQLRVNCNDLAEKLAFDPERRGSLPRITNAGLARDGVAAPYPAQKHAKAD